MATNTIEKTKQTAPPTPSDGFRPMEDCPFIVGNAVVLKGPKGQIEVAKWRITNSFSKESLRWERDSFWATINAGGIRVGFNPVAWKEYKE
jgi:hypothetical protein